MVTALDVLSPSATASTDHHNEIMAPVVGERKSSCDTRGACTDNKHGRVLRKRHCWLGGVYNVKVTETADWFQVALAPVI